MGEFRSMSSKCQYFDAVLNSKYIPVFNGTPEHTRNWLLKHTEVHDTHEVCHGRTLKVVSVKTYLGTVKENHDGRNLRRASREDRF